MHHDLEIELRRARNAVLGDEDCQLVSQLWHPEVNELVDFAAMSGKKLVVILRGLPGSGKSTFARQLEMLARANDIGVRICSADHYFEGPFGYRYEKDCIGAAHAFCRQRFADGISDVNVSLLVIDNINSQPIDYINYIQDAQRAGCDAIAVTFVCDDEDTAIALASRATKRIPVEKIRRIFGVFVPNAVDIHSEYLVAPRGHMWT